MSATIKEDREVPLLSEMLVQLYGSFRGDSIRRRIRSLALKLEGDEYYSLTIRKIFAKYHNREVGLYTGGASFLMEAFPLVTPGIRIGRYTSITPSVRAFNANHPLDWKST